MGAMTHDEARQRANYTLDACDSLRFHVRGESSHVCVIPSSAFSTTRKGLLLRLEAAVCTLVERGLLEGDGPRLRGARDRLRPTQISP